MQRSKQLDIYKPTITKWINDSLSASRSAGVAGQPNGLVPWAGVSKAGSSIADLESHSHGLLSDLTGTDHHTQYVHVSSPRTIAAAHNFTAGLTSPDADTQFVMGRALVGYVGYGDYAGVAHRDYASAGNYALLQGGVGAGNTFLNAPSGQSIYHRINNVDTMIMDAARLNPAGSILKDLGDYNRKWRTLFAAELYVETLVAQSVLATIGGRIMVAPTVKLIADINASQTTIDVDYSSLLLNDYTYMATAPGGLAQIEVMKITGGPTPITGGYRYNVTRALDGTPANSWVAGDALVSLGNAIGKGYIELTSTSTIHNHLGPNITIYSRTGTAAWNDVKPTVSMGNLRSFVDYSSDEVGFAVGNDLTLSPASGFKGSTNDRTNGLRMFNTSIKEYQGGTLFLTLDTGGLYFTGVDQSYAKIRWSAAGGVPDYDIGAFTGGDSYNRMDLRAWSASKSAVRLGAWNSGQTGSPVAYVEVRQDTFASEIIMSANGVGIGVTPTATLDVVRGGLSSGTAVFRGTAIDSHFNFSSSEDTYIRGGKATSQIFINDAHTGNINMAGGGGNVIVRGVIEFRGDDSAGASSFFIRNDGANPVISSKVGDMYWGFSGRTNLSHRFYPGGTTSEVFTINSGGISVNAGTARFGNASDLFGAKIQTSGNIHAQGAITSDTFWQVAVTTPPGAAAGYCRVTLRSSDNALVAVMPSGNVRVLAVN